jgi:hypothetical protein
MKHDLINPSLFGNDAGEDEPLEVLNSYFLEKPDFKPFFDLQTRLGFVRSRKGVGKSALLRQALFRRQLADDGELLIYVKASDLVALQNIDLSSPSSLVHGWQQRICSRINLALGSVLRVAFSDASMALVEQAEVSGFRGRNLVGSLLDRLRVKAVDVEISRERVALGDSQALLSRFMQRRDIVVWLFIDDIDATFINTEQERLSVSTFFSACRNLANSVGGLNIRASVRTDVWSIIAQYDEALDKCDQYMLDLKWSTEESGRILSNKIKSYFERTYGNVPKVDSISRLVFREPFRWGRVYIPSYKPIHILSAGRPRWATHLCRLSGRLAHRVGHDLISITEIRRSLKDYGQSRLSDLYKEHRHQCPKIEILLEAFAGSSARFTTAELLLKIQKDIIDRFGVPDIDSNGSDDPLLSIAHFLYRIGFLNARDETLEDSTLGFVQFDLRPHLLSSSQNPDDGLNWEIHPSYREVLRIGTIN